MEREVIDNAGLEHFAEIGLVIFVAVFVLILLRVFFMKNDYAEKMRNIPLDENQKEDTRNCKKEVGA